MKRQRALIILLLLGAAACMMPTYVTTYQAKNDLVMKSTWTDFLQANPAPKVVLRVPDPPNNITQQQMMA